MKDIDVSIVIPVYNVEDYIWECIESVISQDTKYAIECIFVDDRGDDRSIAKAHEKTDVYSGDIEFRYITHDKNKGVSAARNTGIREARGKYLYYLDPDDIITPDCIGALMKRAEEYPAAQIIIGDTVTFPAADLNKGVLIVEKNFPDYSDNKRWIKSVFFTRLPDIVCNKLIKIEFIRENGLFFREGLLHEDIYWHLQAYDKIEALAFVKKNTYIYKVRGSSITTDKRFEGKRIDGYIAICDKLVSRERNWDVGWTKCLRNFLCFFKYYPEGSEKVAETRQRYNEYIDMIQKQDKAPLAMKLYFKYWGKKAPGSNEIILNILFNLYWYLYDVARFRRPMI